MKLPISPQFLHDPSAPELFNSTQGLKSLLKSSEFCSYETATSSGAEKSLSPQIKSLNVYAQQTWWTVNVSFTLFKSELSMALGIDMNYRLIRW